jgi:hypothetical protein
MLASDSTERSMHPTMPHAGAKPKKPATLPVALIPIGVSQTADKGMAKREAECSASPTRGDVSEAVLQSTSHSPVRSMSYETARERGGLPGSSDNVID